MGWTVCDTTVAKGELTALGVTGSLLTVAAAENAGTLEPIRKLRLGYVIVSASMENEDTGEAETNVRWDTQPMSLIKNGKSLLPI